MATDQKRDPADLSPTSIKMLAAREKVLAEWEARVRSASEKASKLPHPILMDTLPAFYDNLAEAATPGYPRASAVDGTNIAAEHGSERARLTAYDHETLIAEYQIFRWVVFEVLHREDVVLTHPEILAINASLDAAIREAVSAFASSHTMLRERFAAALTHDLRGPVGSAAIAMELILLGNDPANMKLLASKALQNMQRMDGMIRELLDSMAFHAGVQVPLRMEQFDIQEVLGDIRAEMNHIHAARIEVGATPVVGWWDRNAFRRAIDNLVSNALKYGDEQTPVKLQAVESHGNLVITVHNEGKSIPLEEQQAIFRMYERAEQVKLTQHQGWGIGLPYVRTVAESHGGTVLVDSGEERGTTFTIQVPVDARPFLVTSATCDGAS